MNYMSLILKDGKVVDGPDMTDPHRVTKPTERRDRAAQKYVRNVRQGHRVDAHIAGQLHGEKTTIADVVAWLRTKPDGTLSRHLADAIERGGAKGANE